jgi:membrane-associated phospholipid phosphatase
MNDFYELGINMVLLCQNLGEWMLGPMNFFSFLGTMEFSILIMPILYWSIDVALGLRLGIILIISASTNSILKMAFHTPRPFWYSREVSAYAFEDSFGMPSGHAQNSAAVLGLLATSLKRRWVWVVTLLLIFLIGISRMYLAVHFPQDVITGWIIGFILVWLFLRFEKPVVNWLASRNLTRRILAVFAFSLGFLIIGLLVKELLANWNLPGTWLENAKLAFPDENAIDPFDISGLFETSGVLFGFSAGALWLAELGGFDAKGAWWKRLTRYIIGLAGVAVLWFGLGAVIPEGIDVWGLLVDYLLFALIGLWISALAPLLFRGLRLADPKNEKTP